MKTNLIQLELILTFLGIQFIDYKGHRTSNGHKTAKNGGQIKSFFGKEVMTSGQFIEDITWWDFKNDWNDLMFLVDKIEHLLPESSWITIEYSSCWIPLYEAELTIEGEGESRIEAVYNACLEFITWYNEQNK